MAARWARGALAMILAIGVAAARADDVSARVAAAAEAGHRAAERAVADVERARVEALVDAALTPGDAAALARCRARREAAIEVVQARLEATDGLPAPGGVGAWGRLLALAVALNASEVLPALLGALGDTCDDDARAAERDALLAAITAILRQERWPALLAADRAEAGRDGPPAEAEAGEERIAQVIGWCEDLLATPAESRRGARGMAPEATDG